jgi:hypothetical protein
MKNSLPNQVSLISLPNQMVAFPTPSAANVCAGWICKVVVSDSENELGSLLTHEQYQQFLEDEHDEDFDEDDDEYDEDDEDEDEDEDDEDDQEPEEPNRQSRR